MFVSIGYNRLNFEDNMRGTLLPRRLTNCVCIIIVKGFPMTKLFNKKTIFALLFAILSVMLCCITGYAEPLQREQAYFDYSDGVVRDGARNDRPGIIGDELNRERMNAQNDNRDNSRATDNASKREAAGRTAAFWGIVIAMVVAAAVVLLIALIVPKNREQNRNR